MLSRRINLVGREECWTSSTEHRVSFLLKSDNIYSQRTCILQQVDKELRPITKRILTNRKDRDFALRKEVVCKKSKSNVGKKFLLLLPSILRRDLISKCQNEPQANNFGIEKTLARVIENNWWSRMESSVGAYLFSCIHCLFHNVPPGAPVRFLNPILPTDHSRPFESIIKARCWKLHLEIVIFYLWLIISPNGWRMFAVPSSFILIFKDPACHLNIVKSGFLFFSRIVDDSNMRNTPN